MKFFRLIGTRAGSYAGPIAIVIVMQAISMLAVLYLPSLNARIIDQGVSRGDIPYIWRTGALMLGVAFVQVISACIATWFAARTSMGTGRDLRARVFHRVAHFSAEDIGHFGAATLITRGTNDVQQVQMTYMMLLNFMVPVPIMMAGGIIMAIREDPGMSWLVAVSVIVLAIAVGAIIARLMPLFQSQQSKLDRINGILREQISGIRVVRAFTREPYEADRFADANADLTRLSVRIGNLFVLLFPAIMLILNLATGAVMWFGGARVDSGAVEVGSLTAFLQYLMQILAAVMMGAFMAMMLPRAIVCAGRISEVLRRQPSITDPGAARGAAQNTTPAEATPAERPHGTVRFDHVDFTYPGADEPVLDDISLTARPGQTTAIIGSTGAGKSTLLGLILRSYAASAGTVTLDGVDIVDMAHRDIVKRVSLVPQKPYLFSGTVRSNLETGRPGATEAEMWEALRIAQADFVTDLDMAISQGGTNISGGQRQRLSIARMLIARPAVYLFDDSFSALDLATEARLQKALRPHVKDATVIVVAQRVNSIVDADQILVMESGSIVARGTHEELLETSATYQEIVHSQLTEDSHHG